MGSIRMKDTNSFQSAKKFLGLDVYPYGLARSGDYTRKQAILLEEHGEAYKELQTGIREPKNKEEREFVAACRGEKEPETEHEIVWLKFNVRAGKKFVTAFAGSYERSEDEHEYVGGDIELDEE